MARGLHASLCDDQWPARCHRGGIRWTGADVGVRDRGRRHSGAVHGAQSGQVAAFGGGSAAVQERPGMSAFERRGRTMATTEALATEKTRDLSARRGGALAMVDVK